LWRSRSELEQSLNLLERLGGIIEMGQRMAKDQGHERMWPQPPTTPEGSGGSDQVYIRPGPAGVSGESGA
jgi:hypothetical protein